MATSLMTLRQAVGRYLDEMHTGQVTSPGGTSFIDVELIDWHGMGDDKLAGAWVKLVSGAQSGEVRRITAYNDDSGQVTLSRAWTAPAAGDLYELHTIMSPDEIDGCINRALRQCYYVTTARIEYVSGQWRYDLSGVSSLLISPGQIRQVFWRYGDAPDPDTEPDAADESRRHPLRWWQVRREEDGMFLYVRPWATLSTEDSGYEIEMALPHEPLGADADLTDCPAEWVEFGAITAVYDRLARHDPAQDSLRWKQQQAEAAMRFKALTRAYQPRAIPRMRFRDDPL